jgi:mannose-6-phosphate isomerase-like protein (cupin superfamily)
MVAVNHYGWFGFAGPIMRRPALVGIVHSCRTAQYLQERYLPATLRSVPAVNMTSWCTNRLAFYPDYVSASGASEIRLLIQRESGEITHALVPPSSTAEVAILDGITEFFFIATGSGRLRCADRDRDHEIKLTPGTVVRIPAGVHYQYDNPHEEPLEIILAVVPMWTPEYHKRGVLNDAWRPRLRGTRSESEHADTPAHPRSASGETWAVTHLPAEPDHIAPDGSEIRLLGDEPRGGYAHCQLPPGAVTQPVRHRTVQEIWYVLKGRGQLWRHDDHDTEEVVTLAPGICVDIPLHTDFQFRSTGDEPLQLLLLTMPRWPGPDEAVSSNVRRWRPTVRPTRQEAGE